MWKTKRDIELENFAKKREDNAKKLQHAIENLEIAEITLMGISDFNRLTYFPIGRHLKAIKDAKEVASETIKLIRLDSKFY